MKASQGSREEESMNRSEVELSGNIGLHRILECTVILNWNELMKSPTSGLVQIEYRTDATYSLEYLKVWCSTVRGYANLACEYWVCPLWSHMVGLQWVTGYNSAAFATMLESAIQHQDTHSKLAHRSGSIQIRPATEEERIAAMKDAAQAAASLAAVEPLAAA